MKSNTLAISLAGISLMAVVLATPLITQVHAQSHASEGQTESMQIRKYNNKGVAEALKAGDYQAWVETVSNTYRGEPLLAKINEDNFDQFVNMHELYRDGNVVEADSIAQELNIPIKAERIETRRLLSEVVKEGDYQGYLNAIESLPDFPEDQILTEQEFQDRSQSLLQRREQRRAQRAQNRGSL